MKHLFRFVVEAIILLSPFVIQAKDPLAAESEAGEAPSTERATVKVPFAESLGIKFAAIPPGEFNMGSSDTDRLLLQELYPDRWMVPKDETPAHQVRITTLAAISIHEISVGQFRSFIEDTGYLTDADRNQEGAPGWLDVEGVFDSQRTRYTWKYTGFPQTDSHPVVNVTWNDAVAYCKWLSQKDGRQFRLPTEAEWEYCARAGAATVFPNGQDPRDLVRTGNVSDSTARTKLTKYPGAERYEAGSDGFAFTSPVGQFPANRFGLHDMIGNVQEWCDDSKRLYRKSAQTDPVGDNSTTGRVTRGGSWGHNGKACRLAYRAVWSPYERGLTIGFRVAQAR